MNIHIGSERRSLVALRRNLRPRTLWLKWKRSKMNMTVKRTGSSSIRCRRRSRNSKRAAVWWCDFCAFNFCIFFMVKTPSSFSLRHWKRSKAPKWESQRMPSRCGPADCSSNKTPPQKMQCIVNQKVDLMFLDFVEIEQMESGPCFRWETSSIHSPSRWRRATCFWIN